MFREVTADTVGEHGPAGRTSASRRKDSRCSTPVARSPVPLVDNPTSRNFRTAAQAHLARVNPGRIGIICHARRCSRWRYMRCGDSMIADGAAAHRSCRSRRRSSRWVENTTATPPTNTGIVPIEPIMAAPKFPQPMYESLRDLSQQLLLPGLETVEPNSVLGLETNSRFVEAYMVGLNFEMGRELLWRGYPTDQRGTYFDRFWDSRSSGGGADVIPIHGWQDRPLGDPQTAPAGDRFVMLIRSALLRRYPTAVIYAAKAVIVRRCAQAERQTGG